MRKNIIGIAKLREALMQMEADLNLLDLTRSERDVLYAAHSANSAEHEIFSSDVLKQQPSVMEMAHATFHRALSRLLELEYIEHAPNTKAKLYKIGQKSP